MKNLNNIVEICNKFNKLAQSIDPVVYLPNRPFTYLDNRFSPDQIIGDIGAAKSASTIIESIKKVHECYRGLDTLRGDVDNQQLSDLYKEMGSTHIPFLENLLNRFDNPSSNDLLAKYFIKIERLKEVREGISKAIDFSYEILRYIRSNCKDPDKFYDYSQNRKFSLKRFLGL